MNRTGWTLLAFGGFATALGFVFYYGCYAGTGIACPAGNFQPMGLVTLVFGEVLVGLVFLLPLARARTAPVEGGEPPAPVLRRERPARAEAPPPASRPTQRTTLLFCPTCGRRYRAPLGRFCSFDATKLRPVPP